MELNLNIAICDDNETDIQKLINMLESYHIATDTTFHIDTFLNGADLLEKNINSRTIIILYSSILKCLGCQA